MATLQVIANQFSANDPMRFYALQQSKPKEIIWSLVNLPLQKDRAGHWPASALDAAKGFINRYGVLSGWGQDTAEGLLYIAERFREFWNPDIPDHQKAKSWQDIFLPWALTPFGSASDVGEEEKLGLDRGWWTKRKFEDLTVAQKRLLVTQRMFYENALCVDWDTGATYIKARDMEDALAYFIFLHRKKLRFCEMAGCGRAFVATESREKHCIGCKVAAKTERQNRWRRKQKRNKAKKDRKALTVGRAGARRHR